MRPAESDQNLIREWVACALREALAEVIRRHLGFVHSCALRQAGGDVAMAEDVSQAVFILLARRARSIRFSAGDASLRSWLFVATRYSAANAIKMQARRRYHERHAASVRASMTTPSPDDTWDELRPLLDESIARLSERDRVGVLMSYFENKSFREIGNALGVSQDTARKRVARAVEKLRKFFGSRGVVAGSAAICGALTAHASTASAAAVVSPALAQSVTAAALGATTASVVTGSASYAIAKGVSNMFALAKLKLATISLAACVLVGGSAVALVASAWADDKKPTQASSAPSGAGASGHVARFDDDVRVEVVGIMRLGSNDRAWWHIDGSPAEPACDSSSSMDSPPHTHQLCLRVTGAPEDAGIVWKVPAQGWSSQPATKDQVTLDGGEVMTATFKPGQETVDIGCRVACGAWENLFEHQGPQDSSCTSNERGGAAFAPAYDPGDGTTRETVAFDVPDSQARLIAIDTKGVEHVGTVPGSGSTKTFTQMTVHFDVPMDQIDRFILQVRRYDHVAEFKNVTLDPAKRTKAEVSARRD